MKKFLKSIRSVGNFNKPFRQQICRLLQDDQSGEMTVQVEHYENRKLTGVSRKTVGSREEADEFVRKLKI